MKKLVRVLALGIALVMLLSSCSFFRKGNDIGSVLNAEAPYEKDYIVLDSYSKIDGLKDAELLPTSQGNLLHFVIKTSSDTSDYETHLVYDMKKDEFVFDSGKINTVKNGIVKTVYSIKLDEFDETPFIVESKSTYKIKNNQQVEDSVEEYYAYYDCVNDEPFATFSYPAASTVVKDVLYLDGTCYRANENGQISSAFDYSVLAKFPEGIDAKVNGKYYDFVTEGDKGVKIYDDKFSFLKEYEIPSYASLISAIFLKEDKVLLQYAYELDEDDKKFSFIFEGKELELAGFTFKSMTKYNLETVIYDVEKGKAKSVKCPYIIENSIIDSYNDEDLELLDEDVAQALAFGYVIEDKRVKADSDSERTLAVNKRNKIFELDQVNGEAVRSVKLVGKDKWEIGTKSFKYLFNADEIVGEISNATLNGDIYFTGSYFFDMDLKPIYNCVENKLTVDDSIINGAFFFKDAKTGELFFYNGGEDTTKLIDEDVVDDVTYAQLTMDLFVLVDSTNEDEGKVVYSFYNSLGERIQKITCEAGESWISNTSVAASEDAVVIAQTSVKNDKNVVNYYRFYKG